MNCQNVEELLPLLLDGDDAGLNEFERDAVLVHVRSCPLCQEEQRLLQETVAALSYLEELEPPPELRQRIRARVEGYERRSFRGFWRRFGIQLSPTFGRNLAVATASIAVLVTSAAVLTTLGDTNLMESDLRRSEQAPASGAHSTGESRPASPVAYTDTAKGDRASSELGVEAPEPASAPKPSGMQPVPSATAPPKSLPDQVAQEQVAQNEDMPPRIELKARAKDESRREGAKKPKPGDLGQLESKSKPVLSADVYEPESPPATPAAAAPQSTKDERLQSLGSAGDAQGQDAKKGAPEADEEVAEKELLDDDGTQAGSGAGAAGAVSREDDKTSSTSEAERQRKLQKQADTGLDAAAAQATAIAGSTPFYEEAAATRWLPLDEPAGRRDKRNYAQSTDPSQVPSRDVSDVEASVPPALLKELAALQPAVTGGPDPRLEIGFDRRGRPRYLRWARELPAGQVALLNEIGARYGLTLVPPGDAKPTAGPASKVASTEKY